MPEPARFTLITAARLLDGSGAAPVEQAALLIEGDRIVGLGGAAGVRLLHGDDDPLLLQAAKNARTLPHSGVTTLRENGAKGKVAFSLREGIRRRLAPGPRMVICGRPITIATRQITALWDVLDVYHAGRRVDRGVR